MRIEWELAIFAVLLVGLAANPVWFYPAADESTHEYRAVEITDENRHRYVERHPDVLECEIQHDRTCGFEVAARDGGVVVDTSETLYSTSREYSYVDFPTENYRPTLAERNGTVRLTLDSVTVQQVVAGLAHPYADATEQARTVVENGKAVVHREVPDRDLVVNRGDRYYYLEYVGTPDSLLYRWLSHIRWLMWLGTVPLSVGTMWRWSGS